MRPDPDAYPTSQQIRIDLSLKRDAGHRGPGDLARRHRLGLEDRRVSPPAASIVCAHSVHLSLSGHYAYPCGPPLGR
jgi:hypothetical protein